jgi:cell division septation protein DedD
MASEGRRGAGERVLESKHVIGLFLLMLLFSGVFFTLGYVMGRSQYDGQVRAATGGGNKPEAAGVLKSQPQTGGSTEPAATPESTDPAINSPASSAWDFSHVNKPASGEPHLEPAGRAYPASGTGPSKALPAKAQADSIPPPTPAKSSSRPPSAPLVPNGALLLQAAALLRQDDALAVANSLQKKHYAAYVQTPTKDQYYRVQVGPFKDQHTADAAKKGLEGEGFKAFYVKH